MISINFIPNILKCSNKCIYLKCTFFIIPKFMHIFLFENVKLPIALVSHLKQSSKGKVPSVT